MSVFIPSEAIWHLKNGATPELLSKRGQSYYLHTLES